MVRAECLCSGLMVDNRGRFRHFPPTFTFLIRTGLDSSDRDSKEKSLLRFARGSFLPSQVVLVIESQDSSDRQRKRPHFERCALLQSWLVAGDTNSASSTYTVNLAWIYSESDFWS